jgi:hypothetical protein
LLAPALNTIAPVGFVVMLRMLTFAASLLVIKTATELWLAESLLQSPRGGSSLA